MSRTFRSRWIKAALALVAVSVAVIGGAYGVVVVPAGTGMVAKQLCSFAFVSRVDPALVREGYLLPPVAPLGWFLRDEVNEGARVATATSFGFVTARAAHRPGLGCTLLHGDPAEALRAELSPAPPERRAPDFALDPRHRDAAFDAAALERTVADAFAESPERTRRTMAVVVLHDGRLVAERYAPGIDADTPLPGWSMTKSVIASLVGILTREGKLDVAAPAGFPEWSEPGDPRAGITLDQLLRMTSGLDVPERQTGADPVSRMLFLKRDGAAYAAGRPLKDVPGSRFEYTSGNTMLASRLVREAAGGSLADAYAFARRELFDQVGMPSAVLEPDRAGTFVGSSFMFATARDWGRLGLLYLGNGVVEGRRILPEGFVEYVTKPTDVSPRRAYGAGFWLNAGEPGNPAERSWPSLPLDAYAARGFQGQTTFVVPSRQLVIVRLGATRGGHAVAGAEQLAADVIAAMRTGAP